MATVQVQPVVERDYPPPGLIDQILVKLDEFAEEESVSRAQVEQYLVQQRGSSGMNPKEELNDDIRMAIFMANDAVAWDDFRE